MVGDHPMSPRDRSDFIQCLPLEHPVWIHRLRSMDPGCLYAGRHTLDGCRSCSCRFVLLWNLFVYNRSDSSVVCVKSPCIGKCRYDSELELCGDCGRTKEEISKWYIMTEAEKADVLELLKGRGYGPI